MDWADSITVWAEDFANNWADNSWTWDAHDWHWDNNRNDHGTFFGMSRMADQINVLAIDLIDADVDILPASSPHRPDIVARAEPNLSFFADDSESGYLHITERRGLVDNGFPATLTIYLPHHWDFDYIAITTTGHVFIDSSLRLDSQQNGDTLILTPVR